ncbi:MAG: sigma-70 family RNA polymerase sigma factor [Ruminococcaceae bacterium]|nr:sigma-70 family RNA polymerase sigma factor [Oscillospiraceae bacterium]
MQNQKIKAMLKNCRDDEFADIISQFRPLITYIISPILSDTRDKEECISDIYLTVWKKIDQYDPNKSNFTTWLTVIAKNTALNYTRKTNKIRSNEGELDENLVSKEGNPEAELINKENSELLKKAIDSLSKSDKVLFYRKYYYSQPISQIASETGITERAVEGRLYRIKKKLRKQLGGVWYE